MENLLNISFGAIGIYMFFSIGELIYIIRKSFRNGFDELEKKSILDGLAFTMIAIFALHIFQSILASIIGTRGVFVPLVIPGNGRINEAALANIENFIFDIMAFSVIYNLKRYRYGLTSQIRYRVTLFFAATIIFFILMVDISTVINILK